MPSIIPEDTQVWVVNEDDRPHILKWAGRKTVVNPGERKVVNYYAMVRSAGDPRAVDISPRDRYRTNEVARLDAKYGCTGEQEWRYEPYEIERKGEKVKMPPAWPRLRFYALEDETEYNTVLVDPDGISVHKVSETAAALHSRDDQIATLTKQIESLTRAMDALQYDKSRDAADQKTDEKTAEPEAKRPRSASSSRRVREDVPE